MTDIGLVGDVDRINTEAVRDLIAAGRIPVVSTIAPDTDGWCTTSTPTPPPRCGALGAEKLLMLTDVGGLYTRWPDRDSLVSGSTPPLTRLLPTLEGGDGAQDQKPACAPSPGCPAPTSSTAASNTACWWNFSPTREPGRR